MRLQQRQEVAGEDPRKDLPLNRLNQVAVKIWILLRQLLGAQNKGLEQQTGRFHLYEFNMGLNPILKSKCSETSPISPQKATDQIPKFLTKIELEKTTKKLSNQIRTQLLDAQNLHPEFST
uniref:Uncharacterized protein n=1 Tax=Ananas comosus var. bracteatus TaxID=296719 RepID=A0A6V7PHI8_ANACO|nr:unnamed protein product [Ananas comosus var. bracteatus]